MPETDAQLAQFLASIGVMKPNTIDEDKPQHVKKMAEILNSPDYMAERKYDGCHYTLLGHRFFSTDGVEKTHNYPHLRDFFTKLQMSNIILDGEINYPGKTSQFCTRVTGSGADVAVSFQNDYSPIHYTFWDMLRTPRGTWLINEPYRKRREYVEHFYETFVKGTPLEPFIHITDSEYQNKEAFYKDIIAEGGEGIVLKRLDSIYVMNGKPMWQWMKLKQKDTADLFITGFEEPTMEYKGANLENWPYWSEINGINRPVTKLYYFKWFGAIELSAYVNGKVTPICTCSGLNEDLRATISKDLDSYLDKVVKISFMEKTEANYPRHPRFEGFHESKTAIECTWDLNLE